MLSIWKFPLDPCDHPSVMMPAGANILCVQTQRGTPCIWALVDPEAKLEERVLSVHSTGHEVPKDPGTYIGTFQLEEEMLVFHVFEEGGQNEPYLGEKRDVYGDIV